MPTPFEEHSKKVEAKMKVLEDRSNHLRNLDNPWWYSGSACIAALLWLTCVTLITLNALSYTNNPSADSARIIFVLVAAIIFSAMGAGKRNG